MYLLMPVKVNDRAGTEVIPAVNALLITVNILVFCFLPATALSVGAGTGLLSILTYAFAHANLGHLAGNVWLLWLFGNPVNRRLGNAYYLAAYLGTALALGLFGRLFFTGLMLGASGVIFAILMIFMILLPAARVEIAYMIFFPLTVLIGLVVRPGHWLSWFFRFGTFGVRAWWGFVVIPVLELWSLWWSGWNWTNLGHLFGLLCGLAIVLLLPSRVTLRRRSYAEAVA